MYVYKYRPINEHTLSALINNELKFSQPKELNDPFDSQLKLTFKSDDHDILKYLEKHYEIKNISNIEKAISILKDAPDLREIKDEYMLLAFSVLHNNILLWSHYANEHKGLCMKFKVFEKRAEMKGIVFNPNSIPERYRTINKRYGINLNYPEGFLEIKKVKYPVDNEKPEPINVIYDKKDVRLEKAENSLFCKHKCCKYEKEYRIVLPYKIDQNKIFKFNKEYLDSILFGLNCSDTNVEIVKLIIKTKYIDQGYNVKLYKALEDEKKYALKFKKIKIL